jgi:hypothetical protein
MAEVGLQLMHTPFWLRIGSLDETRRIFGAVLLSPTYPFYMVDKCCDTVTVYFRDNEQVA